MSKTSDIIQFHYLESAFSFDNRNACKRFITSLFKKEKTPLDNLTYIFCDDEYLLNINRDFLKHDYYTDIVTFGLSEKGSPVTGEIYISITRVKDNAITHGEPFYRELHRVIFHGALHLCGYRDKSKAEQEKMREMEDKYLNAYFTR
ncbi:rRNA maturation RNase YbeY [Flavihumibacter petaseus]|uniref:Endoribonuclease YbeY n=1 Tax=Flavihumibacter petaseus NBRC 106054 TaxID=1220578 RepID=A0A0E9MXW2_9BACT|nr:rRNA maturation RNase YbeY [Flavihumibacter petaseus]GAO42271.1 putative rRNA maturation factor YbeY [Flavihumibacter petaseus NBRC 106054]